MYKQFRILSLLITLVSASQIYVTGTSAQTPRTAPDQVIDAKVREQVIEALLARLNKSYVFPEVAKRMEQAINERVARGEYREVTSAARLSRKLTDDLREVSRDKHLGIFFSAQPVPQRPEGQNTPSAEERKSMEQMARRLNYGFDKVERLQGNVGYLNLRGFMPAELINETAAAAMNFLANTDALIIDLRQNGGGEPEGVALICSYLFGAEPVHLNDLYWREGDRTQQFFTRASLLGKRYAGKPVYVLTSKETFSGAEEFAYNLKNLKRATLIGETTGGGAHPGGMFRITENFGAFVPTGRAINPITKTNWEGTGVSPDVAVPAAQALQAAHLAAVKEMLAKEQDPMMKSRFQALIEQLGANNPGAAK